jgi:hypothetical protein
LNGAANFEEWPADISRTDVLEIGPFGINMVRKLQWKMTRTKTPDNRRRPAK